MDSTSVTTPTGVLSVVARADGVVVAAGFCTVADLEARLRAETRRRSDLGAASSAVRAYLAGDLEALAAVPVEQSGTPTRQRVWRALRLLPAGTTTSYGELANALGLPTGASRAIGSACGANLIAPFVPCHRVLRAGGGLGGYYYGLPVKTWLLEHEGALVGREPPAAEAVSTILAPPTTRSPASASAS